MIVMIVSRSKLHLKSEEIEMSDYYFRPGCPWIDESAAVVRAKCPVFIYGPEVDRGFLFDTVALGGDNRALRLAYGVAEAVCVALDEAADDPDFRLPLLIHTGQTNV